jgi:DNA-binding transcriptional MerR regulator
MTPAAPSLSPSEAAARLGVSAKALRLYERHGLLAPARSRAGWRVYSPADMARAARIIAFRKLGLSLSHVKRALAGDGGDLEPILAAHQASLENDVRRISADVETIRRLRADLAIAPAPARAKPAWYSPASNTRCFTFDLPWPWAGERFRLDDIRSLNYIIGPLGSGKTRLARRIAEVLPAAHFVDWERKDGFAGVMRAQMEADAALGAKVDRVIARLVHDGATSSDALMALVVALESEGPSFLVIDMLEHGLDRPTQEAVIAHLRNREPSRAPIFCTTRSNAILDLDSIGLDEAIVLCPANHSPPRRVSPFRGAPGYEAVAMCLASPEVRARSEGLVAAWRSPAT